MTISELGTRGINVLTAVYFDYCIAAYRDGVVSRRYDKRSRFGGVKGKSELFRPIIYHK